MMGSYPPLRVSVQCSMSDHRSRRCQAVDGEATVHAHADAPVTATSRLPSLITFHKHPACTTSMCSSWCRRLPIAGGPALTWDPVRQLRAPPAHHHDPLDWLSGNIADVITTTNRYGTQNGNNSTVIGAI